MVHHAALALENQLCFSLSRASRAITRVYQPLLQDLGLTYPQYLVMMVLWEAGDGCSMGELGRRLWLDSGTLTPLLRRLEQAGNLTRRRDPDDERRLIITLTAKGDALQEAAAGIPARLEWIYADAATDLGRLRQELDAVTVLVTDHLQGGDG